MLPPFQLQGCSELSHDLKQQGPWHHISKSFEPACACTRKTQTLLAVRTNCWHLGWTQITLMWPPCPWATYADTVPWNLLVGSTHHAGVHLEEQLLHEDYG